jgi:hypothetical protein
VADGAADREVGGVEGAELRGGRQAQRSVSKTTKLRLS